MIQRTRILSIVAATLVASFRGIPAQVLDWGITGPIAELTGFGQGPAALALNDMDSDGDADLVCCNRVSNTVAVFRNNGGGAFSHIHTYTLGGGQYPSDIFFADLDGSSPVDMIVANYQSGSFTRRRGNGDGSFGTPTVFPIGAAGARPWSIAARRLRPSGAGIPTGRDVVVTDPGNNVVWIFPATGSGTTGSYDTPFSLPASGNPDDLAIDDIDGDLDQDIIITVNGNPSYLKVFGNTNSQLLTAAQFPSSLRTLSGGAAYSEFRGFAIGDLVGDSRKDIAVVQWLSPQGTVEIFRGAGPNASGAPTFVHHASLPAGELTRDVVITDVDGDSDDDIVAIDAAGGTMRIFVNAGGGQFDEGAIGGLTVGDADPLPLDLATTDLDGDGLPEFIVGSRNSNAIRIYQTIAGSDGFSLPSELVVGNGTTLSMTVGFGASMAGALWLPAFAIQPITPSNPVFEIDPINHTFLAMSLSDSLFQFQQSLVASGYWAGVGSLSTADAIGFGSAAFQIPALSPTLLPIRVRLQPIATHNGITLKAFFARYVRLR